jgi:hypothetical protein
VAGDGNQDMVKVLRHSQKKWRETGLPHLSPRRHSLTLPQRSTRDRQQTLGRVSRTPERTGCRPAGSVARKPARVARNEAKMVRVPPPLLSQSVR